MAENQYLSIEQADKFGQAFKEAIQASFPDLRPTVSNQGSQGIFGPINVERITVQTDNKLYFKIEDSTGKKYAFNVKPIIIGEVKDDSVSVVVHWEVDGLSHLTRFLPIEMGDAMVGLQLGFNGTSPARVVLEAILREKNSTITSLVSEPQTCGLEDYQRAKEMIQGYLDEFSSIVFMDMILDTYG